MVRLLPNPWALGKNGEPIGSRALLSFPPVELEFTYSEQTRNLLLKDVRAVVDFESSDLLLPEYPNDLRLQRQSTCRIAPAILSTAERTVERLPSLASFISKSKLDPRSDQHLTTPPGLILPISKYHCKRGAHKLVREHSGNLDYNVDYLYAGLEYRNTLVFDYKGWRLVYTSVEAGKAGGRRSELSLRPVREDSQPVQARDYLEAALSLADAQKPGSSHVMKRYLGGGRWLPIWNNRKTPGFGMLLDKGLDTKDGAGGEPSDKEQGENEQDEGQHQVAIDVKGMMETLQATVQKKRQEETQAEEDRARKV